MSQGKCKPPDKRYRRKKKLLPGSLVVLFLGVLFIAVLAGMKSAQFLEPINTSFTPRGESSKGIEQESYRFSPEADEKSYGKGEENNGSGINPEAEDAKLQRTQSAVSSSDPDLKNDTGDDAGEDSVLIDAPYISQLGTYPTGCESVSAVMALQHLGIDITVDEFIDRYLDLGTEPWTAEDGTMHGGDPWETFLGNPREASGWGCYAPVIERAIKKAVDPDQFQVSLLFGIPLDVLCETYLQNNIPVILWATIDMEYPTPGDCWLIEGTGEELQWMRPEHCLLLVGYDQDYYYFNDPTAGRQYRYEKSACEAAYQGLHSQAVAVYEKSYPPLKTAE